MADVDKAENLADEREVPDMSNAHMNGDRPACEAPEEEPWFTVKSGVQFLPGGRC